MTNTMLDIFDREMSYAAKRQRSDDEFMSYVADIGFAAAITKHNARSAPEDIRGLAEYLPAPTKL